MLVFNFKIPITMIANFIVELSLEGEIVIF